MLRSTLQLDVLRWACCTGQQNANGMVPEEERMFSVDKHQSNMRMIPANQTMQHADCSMQIAQRRRSD